MDDMFEMRDFTTQTLYKHILSDLNFDKNEVKEILETVAQDKIPMVTAKRWVIGINGDI